MYPRLIAQVRQLSTPVPLWTITILSQHIGMGEFLEEVDSAHSIHWSKWPGDSRWKVHCNFASSVETTTVYVHPCDDCEQQWANDKAIVGHASADDVRPVMHRRQCGNHENYMWGNRKSVMVRTK